MSERLIDLIDAYLEGRLTEAEAGELGALLRAEPEARRAFWDYVEQDALIDDILGESRGRDLALAESGNADSSAVPMVTTPRSARLRTWATGLTALAASLLAVIWLSLPSFDAALATVSAVAGDVQIIDGAGRITAVQLHTALSPGEVLHVGDDESHAELSFRDGAQVALGAGTDVRFLTVAAAQAGGLHLEKGAVQVQTAAQTRTLSLILTTDHARITASATRFRLYREAHGSRVELEEGRLRLESPIGAPAVDVTEGSYVVVSGAAEPMVPQPLPLGQCRLRHTFLKAGDAACFSRDGTRLVASHFHRGWKAWAALDGTLEATAPGSGQRSSDMALALDTGVVLGNGGKASFWKVGEPQPSSIRLRDKQLRCGAVSEDGRWLAQGTSSGEVAVWQADPAEGTVSLRQSLAIRPTRVALSCQGPLVAVSRWGGEIHLFDVNTGREVAKHKLRRTAAPLALSADGRFLAAFANDDGLVLFDEQTGARHGLWPGAVARVGCLAFSPEGDVVCAGLDDGTVRAWATQDGSSLLVLDTGHRSVSRATVTVDKSLLATVGDNDCVKVWECRLP